MASFMLFFFPLDVLDEIWDLTESVSEGFLTYSYLFDQFFYDFQSSFESFSLLHKLSEYYQTCRVK